MAEGEKKGFNEADIIRYLVVDPRVGDNLIAFDVGAAPLHIGLSDDSHAVGAGSIVEVIEIRKDRSLRVKVIKGIKPAFDHIPAVEGETYRIRRGFFRAWKLVR